jgi:xanthine dehydrogenase accessory factor
MLIDSNAQTFETIGGGAGEAEVIQQAQLVLATGKKRRIELDLSGAPQRHTQGICGGRMQVWLEQWQGERAIALVQQILDRLQSGQSIKLVTPFAPASFPYLLNANDLAIDSAIAESIPNVWVEVLQPPPLLLIIGAGHCGIQLAKVAHLVGFQIAVQDDRPDWANVTNYPQADLILTEPIAEAIARLTQHDQLYAALLTRGYQYDLAALAHLLQRTIPCQYIGMIGSGQRIQRVKQAIAALGISQAKLRSLHAPIGLEIGALTPAEIAVSIAAELILVRRGASDRPCSQLYGTTQLG